MPEKELKEVFRALAIEHSKVMEEGNHKLANRIHNELTQLYRQKKDSNELSFFVVLTKDNNDFVRHWAATFSIKESPEVAESVLTELASQTSIVGLSAKTTLHLWKKGLLDLL